MQNPPGNPGMNNINPQVLQMLQAQNLQQRAAAHQQAQAANGGQGTLNPQQQMMMMMGNNPNPQMNPQMGGGQNPLPQAPSQGQTGGPPVAQQSMMFNRAIAKFMEERGTPWPKELTSQPEGEAGQGWSFGSYKIGERWIDVFQVYQIMQRVGGWQKIISQPQALAQVIRALNLPGQLSTPHVVPAVAQQPGGQPNVVMTQNPFQILVALTTICGPWMEYRRQMTLMQQNSNQTQNNPGQMNGQPQQQQQQQQQQHQQNGASSLNSQSQGGHSAPSQPSFAQQQQQQPSLPPNQQNPHNMSAAQQSQQQQWLRMQAQMLQNQQLQNQQNQNRMANQSPMTNGSAGSPPQSFNPSILQQQSGQGFKSNVPPPRQQTPVSQLHNQSQQPSQGSPSTSQFAHLQQQMQQNGFQSQPPNRGPTPVNDQTHQQNGNVAGTPQLQMKKNLPSDQVSAPGTPHSSTGDEPKKKKSKMTPKEEAIEEDFVSATPVNGSVAAASVKRSPVQNSMPPPSIPQPTASTSSSTIALPTPTSSVSLANPPAPPHRDRYKVEYTPLTRHMKTYGGWDVDHIESTLNMTKQVKFTHSVNALGELDITGLTLRLRSRLQTEITYTLSALTLLSAQVAPTDSSASASNATETFITLLSIEELFEEMLDVLEEFAFGEDASEPENEAFWTGGISEKKPSTVVVFAPEDQNTSKAGAEKAGDEGTTGEEADHFPETSKSGAEKSASKIPTQAGILALLKNTANQLRPLEMSPSAKKRSLPSDSNYGDEANKPSPTASSNSWRIDVIFSILTILRNFTTSSPRNQHFLAQSSRFLKLLARLGDPKLGGIELGEDEGYLIVMPKSRYLSTNFTLHNILNLRKDVLVILANIGLEIDLSKLDGLSPADKRRLFHLSTSFIFDTPVESSHPVTRSRRSTNQHVVDTRPHQYLALALDALTRLSGPDSNRAALSQLFTSDEIWQIYDRLVRLLTTSPEDFVRFSSEEWLAFYEHISMALFNMAFSASLQLKTRMRRQVGHIQVFMKIIKLLSGKQMYDACLIRRLVELLGLLNGTEDSDSGGGKGFLTFGSGPLDAEGTTSSSKQKNVIVKGWLSTYDSVLPQLMSAQVENVVYSELEASYFAIA